MKHLHNSGMSQSWSHSFSAFGALGLKWSQATSCLDDTWGCSWGYSWNMLIAPISWDPNKLWLSHLLMQLWVPKSLRGLPGPRSLKKSWWHMGTWARCCATPTKISGYVLGWWHILIYIHTYIYIYIYIYIYVYCDLSTCHTCFRQFLQWHVLHSCTPSSLEAQDLKLRGFNRRVQKEPLVRVGAQEWSQGA